MGAAEFFRQVTGRLPFPWQLRLMEETWPSVVDIPTGLGKTAAVVVAWLWKRLRGQPETGRRLVYCLPMRSLVAQTRSVADHWCRAAGPAFESEGRPPPSVHVLMGGEADAGWEESPEAEAILVGTQDMLLSRALNRGYGLSRYRWPISFGLLNQDVLWVLDETQLMGVGVETTAQLHAFRESLGTLGPSTTIWMSATVGSSQLDTVDHPQPAAGFRRLCLGEADRHCPEVARRWKARKPVGFADIALTPASRSSYARDLAELVRVLHSERRGLTLVVVNRVKRAQDLFTALAGKRGAAGAVRLLHSRFRPADRRDAEAFLGREEDRIVIATQAVEAGVDVSARTLVTELAPWPSLVQRFGRLNRFGREAEAHALVVDVDGAGDLPLPYEAGDLEEARRILEKVRDAGPSSLAAVSHEPRTPIRPVLRRKDTLDLFDTTPDLLGNDMDVAPFVRDEQDTDVRFYWRDYEGDTPSASHASPHRDELCAVSLGSARRFLRDLRKRRDSARKKKEPGAGHLRALSWDPLEERWRETQDPRPGRILLLHVAAGGYDSSLGFTGRAGERVAAVPPPSEEEADGMSGDPDSFRKHWVSLPDHLRHVKTEAESLASRLGLRGPLLRAVVTAAAWHDVGKAHPVFQEKLRAPAEGESGNLPPREDLWAKSAGGKGGGRGGRPGFRHELASALAWLTTRPGGAGDGRWENLVAYLTAAHHGKVRLSIRSLPGETRPPEPERLFARGVWDGDEVPAVVLPDGTEAGPTRLDLTPLLMGQGSWLERMLALRDDPGLGPFRLALLEAVLRIADWRASAKEDRDEYA